ncbi:hypothetical protein CYQ70_12590, partial [Enterococcus faecium]|uniref:hypothetical protein n=1 Tax=Enterococcus faecium TaxID=1352 RepID=UPI001025BD4E
SVDRDISDTYFNKMCQRIKAMNYSGFRILKNKFDYLREYIEIKFLNYIISYEHSLRCHAMNGSYFIEKEWF